jgi:hypothetical protein
MNIDQAAVKITGPPPFSKIYRRLATQIGTWQLLQDQLKQMFPQLRPTINLEYLLDNDRITLESENDYECVAPLVQAGLIKEMIVSCSVEPIASPSTPLSSRRDRGFTPTFGAQQRLTCNILNISTLQDHFVHQ